MPLHCCGPSHLPQLYFQILEKFRLKLSDKQLSLTQKIYQVSYLNDVNIIDIQWLIDMEQWNAENELYNQVKMEDSREELKMDLAGYMGDFDRHRGEKQ